MAYLPKWEASTTVSNRRLVGSKGSWKSGWKVPTLGFNHYTYDNVWYGVVLRHSWLRRYELQPKFTAMESSIRGVSIFWKLSWGLENDNTLFKNDNVCLCWSWSSVILCLTAQVIQCISYERSKRQNLFLSIDVWWLFAFGSHFGSDICWSSMYPVAMHQAFLKTTLRLSKQKGFP